MNTSPYHAGQQAYWRGEMPLEDEGAHSDEWLDGWVAAQKQDAGAERAEDERDGN
jgi:hypothetical protein